MQTSTTTIPNSVDESSEIRTTRAYAPSDTWAKFRLTDIGNAERFARRHGAKVRYCHVWKKWLVWDGTRWLVDTMGHIERLAKQTVRAIYAEASEPDLHDTEVKEVVRHARSSERAKAVPEMLRLAQSEPSIPIAVDTLDAHPWLLNCKNGTIDLKTGQLREHHREDLRRRSRRHRQ